MVQWKEAAGSGYVLFSCGPAIGPLLKHNRRDRLSRRSLQEEPARKRTAGMTKAARYLLASWHDNSSTARSLPDRELGDELERRSDG